MIRQPDFKNRNINEKFYMMETMRIKILNEKFFNGIELTKSENDILVWLCGWDSYVIDGIVSAFEKIK